ncbi:MAG TPA: DUF1638 domain-containing protein [Burkholderiaceae bacterium]|nr:DUF1638 domain-containing protein [Burkholderiaceae bacterium]
MTASAAAATPAVPRTLLLACGALAHEIVALKTLHQWQHLDVQCLPAELHNRPERIPEAVRAQIAAHRDRYPRLFVVYADCGTGGALDRVLDEEHVERIGGAHCYEFYAGSAAFARLHDDAPGTFYLTDFLLRHFDPLVIRALGLDRHPELRDQYFGHYTRLVFLAQRPPTEETVVQARAAADRLGLALEVRNTGYGELERSLTALAWHPTPRAEPAWRP